MSLEPRGDIVGSRTDLRTYIVCSLNNRKFAEADTRDTLAYGALRALFSYTKFTVYKLPLLLLLSLLSSLLLFVIVIIALIMFLTWLCYQFFFFTAYNDETQVRQSFYPSASANELKVHSHQALFFPAKKVRSCEAYRPAAKSYEIFMPQLKRRGTLVQEKQVKIKGLKLVRWGTS